MPAGGAPIAAPDEMDPDALTGLAEGDGMLAVPAGHVLTVFGRPTISMTGGPKRVRSSAPRRRSASKPNPRAPRQTAPSTVRLQRRAPRHTPSPVCVPVRIASPLPSSPPRLPRLPLTSSPI